MVSLTRSSARALAQQQGLVSNQPAAPSPVDLEIGRNNGITVAMEATTERLQASKKLPVPDLAQRVQQLTKDNGRLRLEVAYHQNLQRATENLREDVRFVIESLERAIAEFSNVQRVVEEDRQRTMEGVHNR
jgi:hypothetical protein